MAAKHRTANVQEAEETCHIIVHLCNSHGKILLSRPVTTKLCAAHMEKPLPAGSQVLGVVLEIKGFVNWAQRCQQRNDLIRTKRTRVA